MLLDDITGNDRLIKTLRNTINSNNIFHAYIFEGQSSVNKISFVNAFIKAVLCQYKYAYGCDECPICKKVNHGNHEDVIYIKAEENSIKDEAILELQSRLKKKPFLGSRNIAVIENADGLTVRAQNRLLKTLEEPPGKTILIMLSENLENFLPTILSRCVVYKIHSFDEKVDSEITAIAMNLIELLHENAPFYVLNEKCKPFIKEREEAMHLLDEMEVCYGNMVIISNSRSREYKRNKIYYCISQIEEARRNLQNGINTGYALKSLLLRIGG